MKKNVLISLLALTGILGVCNSANAQIIAPKFGADNFAVNHVGSRFAIMAPAGIAGVKSFTLSNDGSGLSNQWGGAITSTISNIEVVKAYDTLGLVNPLVNGTGSFPALTGKFALIYRGGSVDFSTKAKLCQDKGAIGCIIVNNIPGEPVGMGAGSSATGVTIPVIMVSDVVGASMNTQLRASQVVRISLTNWGFNYTHDLGLLNEGLSLPPNYAMPFSQMAANNGNPVSYQGQTGAYIGNFGTSNETNVKLVSNVTWTPTNGATASYRKDSVSFPTFNRADSIMVGFVPGAYDLHATGTGKFEMNYTLSMDARDSSLTDNSGTAVMHVTDSIFSKTRYDFANGVPITPLATAPGGVANYIWGPLYHTTQAGYAMRSVQMAVAISGQPTLGGVSKPINILVFKWDDLNAPTSIMTGDELTLVGFGSRTFTGTDSSFRFVNIDIRNTNNPLTLARTEANATYWVAADVPDGTLLCVDGVLNYTPRLFVRSRPGSTTPVIDLYAPQFSGDEIELGTNGPLVRPVFLEGYSATNNFPDSVRYSVQSSGYIPAIALKISKDIPNSVNSNVKEAFTQVNLFPNPATDKLNCTVKLENQTSKLFVNVLDGVGRTLRTEVKQNVKDESFSLDISSYAPGQYYLILNADEGSTIKKFTVVGK